MLEILSISKTKFSHITTGQNTLKLQVPWKLQDTWMQIFSFHQ